MWVHYVGFTGYRFPGYRLWVRVRVRVILLASIS